MKYFRVGRCGAESAYAQGRVGLGGVGQEGHRLVGAGVQRAHHDSAPAELREHRTVNVDLFSNRWCLSSTQEAELGTVQTHSLGATLEGYCDVLSGSDVRKQGDAVAVGGASGICELLGLRLADCRGRSEE